MKTSTIRSIAFTAVTLTTIGFIGATIASRSFAKEPVTVKQTPSWENYDWAKSEANLRAIGQALQIYRQHNGITPVAQRRNWRDAGFLGEPAGFASFLTVPGKAWSLPKSVFLTKGAYPHAYVGSANITKTSYFCLIRPNPHHDPYYASTEEVNGAWSARGEDLPLLVDFTMHDVEAFSRIRDVVGPVLILRLDGRVERVTVRLANLRELLLEK